MSTPKIRYFLLALILSLGLDQGTKIWARHSLKPIYPQVVSVIKGHFEFRYSENTGSAFGLLRNMPGAIYIFFLVGVGALYVVYSYLKKAGPEERRLGLFLGLLASGAVGNLIDRGLFKKVTDFIVWRTSSFEWPTFNIADAALVVGILGLVLFTRPPKEPAQA